MASPNLSLSETQQRALSDLIADSFSYARFPEKMNLLRLATDPSPSTARALDIVATAERLDSAPVGLGARHAKIPEFASALKDLKGPETDIVRACIDRCLKKLRAPETHDGVHSAQVWRLAFIGTPDGLVSLFRVALDGGFPVSPEVRRNASLALSSHKHPLSAGLVKKTVRHLESSTLLEDHKRAIISGLASGVALHIALVISATLTNGKPPVNDASATGRFHHLSLAKFLIEQSDSLPVRHDMIAELARLCDPLFLASHPLMPGNIFGATCLRMPPFIVELLRVAVNLPDHVAQRAAVQAVFRSYREGGGHEGAFITQILAGHLGWPAARLEAAKFLELFPKKHQEEVRRAVRALKAAHP